MNSLKTEEAGLRDALLKMQALNEGLGQDKVELSKIIMQLEQANGVVEVGGIFMISWWSFHDEWVVLFMSGVLYFHARSS